MLPSAVRRTRRVACRGRVSCSPTQMAVAAYRRRVTTTAPARVEPRDAPEDQRLSPRWGLAVLFTVTSFFGAALLFTVQPLVARLLLPSYGGSATVWSTSSLFFQVLLLVGYLYSHWSTRSLGRRRQPWLHLAVLAVPLVVLPVALPASAAPGDQSPVLWLLRTLTLMIGLPFVVLATTGPLLQRWYSWSGGPRADDPYFMFAAGNLGSFGGLLAYPFVIEPWLSLTDQRLLFTAGFAVFVALTALCAVAALRGRGDPVSKAVNLGNTAPPGRREMLAWGLLAFLPSCLMLAVTAHLATDVASIPLLWVAPLALYLATFVAAFARTARHVPTSWPRAGAALAACAGATFLLTGGLSIWLLLGLDLMLLAVVGFVAHARLAASRPSPEHLTTFYLVIAAGGAAGGLVNGLVAPVAFDRVLEYPLVVASVPALLIGLGASRRSRLENRYGPVAAAATSLLLTTTALVLGSTLLASSEGPAMLGVLALIGSSMWVAASRPLVLVSALVASTFLLQHLGDADVLARDRTFYGSYVVSGDADGRSLRHGTTLHGLQAADQPTEPTTYYARTGPLGDVMESVRPARSGVVGLGTGTIAAYGRAGDRMTFFEIDRAVADVAADADHFTFLRDSAASVDVRVGDGRLLLADEAPGSYDLLVLDAFSSDSIPVHLLTREAFRLYASRVTDGGTIAVHVSNRVFDLGPVVSAAGRDLDWGAAVASGGSGPLATPSTWIVLTSDQQRLDDLTRLGWSSLGSRDPVSWTDDYSSVLDVLK